MASLALERSPVIFCCCCRVRLMKSLSPRAHRSDKLAVFVTCIVWSHPIILCLKQGVFGFNMGDARGQGGGVRTGTSTRINGNQTKLGHAWSSTGWVQEDNTGPRTRSVRPFTRFTPDLFKRARGKRRVSALQNPNDANKPLKPVFYYFLSNRWQDICRNCFKPLKQVKLDK